VRGLTGSSIGRFKSVSIVHDSHRIVPFLAIRTSQRFCHAEVILPSLQWLGSFIED
jgi:hypothetical protein